MGKSSVSMLIRNYLDTGDEKFFEELIEDFQPLIKYYARKLYYLEYEDGIQELTLAIYEALRKIKSIDKEYECISYINKSVIHKFCKLYYKSIDEQKIQQCCVSIDCNNNQEYALSHDIEDCITYTDLLTQLKDLSSSDKNIIYLLLMGYSDKEIGFQLGYSRQYVNRTKKKLLN